MVSILTFIIMIAVGAAVLGFIAVSAMFLIWWERKVSAHIQTRYGPMRVGWHGVLQSVADVIKLLLKENIVPEDVDKPIWWLAPFFARSEEHTSELQSQSNLVCRLLLEKIKQ